VVVSTVVFHCKETVVAATRSIMHRRANIHPNNRGALKMVTIKIPSLSLLLAGSHLLQALVVLRVALPHHLLAPMDLMEEDRRNRPQATHNPSLMAMTRRAEALWDMVMTVDDQGTHIEEKMEIHTEHNETHTADSIVAVEPMFNIC
jgi:hypothetical protein